MFEAYSETEDLKDILCDLVLHGVRRGTLCDFYWAFRSLLSLLEHIKRIGRTVWSRARPCLSDRSIQTHTHARTIIWRLLLWVARSQEKSAPFRKRKSHSRMVYFWSHKAQFVRVCVLWRFTAKKKKGKHIRASAKTNENAGKYVTHTHRHISPSFTLPAVPEMVEKRINAKK